MKAGKMKGGKGWIQDIKNWQKEVKWIKEEKKQVC